MTGKKRTQWRVVALGFMGPQLSLKYNNIYYSIIYNIIYLRTYTVNRTRFYLTGFVIVFVLCCLAATIRCSLIRFISFEAGDIHRSDGHFIKVNGWGFFFFL